MTNGQPPAKKSRVDEAEKAYDSWDDDEFEEGPSENVVRMTQLQAEKASQAAAAASQAVAPTAPPSQASRTPAQPASTRFVPLPHPSNRTPGAPSQSLSASLKSSATAAPLLSMTRGEALKISFQLDNTKRDKERLQRELADEKAAKAEALKRITIEKDKEIRALRDKLRSAEHDITALSFRNQSHNETAQGSQVLQAVDQNESVRSLPPKKVVIGSPANPAWNPGSGFGLNRTLFNNSAKRTATAAVAVPSTTSVTGAESTFQDCPSQLFVAPHPVDGTPPSSRPAPLTLDVRPSSPGSPLPSPNPEATETECMTEDDSTEMQEALEYPYLEDSIRSLMRGPHDDAELEVLIHRVTRTEAAFITDELKLPAATPEWKPDDTDDDD